MRAAHVESMSTLRENEFFHRAGEAARLALLVAAVIVTALAWASTAAQSAATRGPPEAVAQLGD